MALPLVENMVEAASLWRQARFTRAAGLAWVRAGDAGVYLRLPCASGLRDAAGGIDPRAIVAMLDHAASAAIYRVIPAATPIATLELRVAFARPASPGGALTLHARTPQIAGGVALVEATACDEASGAVVAQAAGSFFVGASPGGDTERSDTGEAALHELGEQTAAHFDSFESFAGLMRGTASASPLPGNEPNNEPNNEPTGARAVRLPFAPRLIGAESLPALHGGAVAAVLATAGCDLTAGESAHRLAVLTVQYLRAGRAEETQARAVFDKRGARANFVSVIATQANGTREVARAQCIFVAGA